MFSGDLWERAEKETRGSIIREMKSLSLSLSLQWPLINDYQHVESLAQLAASPEVARLAELFEDRKGKGVWKLLSPPKDPAGNFIPEAILVWAHLLASRNLARTRAA